MPNWVQNRFTVSGTAEQLKAFQERVCQLDTENDADKAFDFNRFIPMPEELRVSSGSTGSIGYDAFYGNASAVLCYPWVVEAGVTNREELHAFLDRQNPAYRQDAAIYHNNLLKYGAPTWYEWCTEHWGTKWNAGSVDIRELTDTQLEVFFTTAWGFPEPIIARMVAAHPELAFAGQVDEEGGFFYLEFTGTGGVLEVQAHEGIRVGGPYDYGDEDEDEDEDEEDEDADSTG